MGIPLNIDWQQILLYVFNFVILAGGLYFLLYSPVKKFMAKRDEHYRKMDSDANEKLASASALEKEAQARLDNVEDEIMAKRVKAEEELDKYSALQMQAANDKADKIIADAKKAADEERQTILSGADRDIIDMTKSLAAKMVHASTDAAFGQFLDIAERDAQNDK